jgi:flagellar biosynthesis protein FlhG
MIMHISEGTMDQAAGLRRMANLQPVKVVAVASGKGGVGKSNVSINLGITLARLGRKVMLMDADLGLANIDVMLGLNARYNLSHVISGECGLEEVILEGPAGLKIVPAASGKDEMARLQTVEYGGLIRSFGELSHDVDILLVDTGAGIPESVVTFTRAAHEVVVVVCDEPASLTDAYALIKVLNRQYGVNRFHILANMTHSASEGRELFAKLSKVAQRFLDVSLSFMGSVPFDEFLRKSVQRQQAVVEAFPRSCSAIAFKKLARGVDNWPVSGLASGRLEFFVERLILAR